WFVRAQDQTRRGGRHASRRTVAHFGQDRYAVGRRPLPRALEGQASLAPPQKSQPDSWSSSSLNIDPECFDLVRRKDIAPRGQFGQLPLANRAYEPVSLGLWKFAKVISGQAFVVHVEAVAARALAGIDRPPLVPKLPSLGVGCVPCCHDAARSTDKECE